MLVCKLTDGKTCKEDHRTNCNGLVTDCKKYEKGKSTSLPKESPKK